ncbi:hypothetical protein PAXRUDRAFT_157514, partial [Paxillus rubicundulus Ve08.2h10]
FWFPTENLGFQVQLNNANHEDSIFFYEALTVCAAVHEATKQIAYGSHLAVFTNNLNTVQMFNSLTALPSMNWMLIQTVDVLLNSAIDFRVFHIPGSLNVVADHLSHLRNDLAAQASLGLRITSFQPPHHTLGEAKK